MDDRPKIEIVRVASTERGNFRPLDGIQLRAAYSHVRIGMYCPEPEEKTVYENKPPMEQPRKYKKNVGPVSRLLRRRHQTTCLQTKSCDNIYSVNRNITSLDWKHKQVDESGLQAHQSNSLDWRVGRTVNTSSDKLDWRNGSRSTEQLSRNAPLTSNNLTTSSTKSKIVSLLRRLSPRLSRPGSKASLPSSPTVCPWVQVEYSTESINSPKREESQETDISFQRELQMNEIRKKNIGVPLTQPNTVYTKNSSKRQNLLHPRIEVQTLETTHTACIFRAVQDDRGLEDCRRHKGPASGEVAGLEEIGNKNLTATLVPDSGGTGRANRRTRPLSLAVQPLNYLRLDPDITTNISKKHPNMTSQESIGSCSLDVDRSTSDRSETTVGSLSEKTLHSFNLSCNGEQFSSAENLRNGSSETLQPKHASSNGNDSSNVSNGHHYGEVDQLTVKKPSYLGLACSINGYSGITRYDSKLREGFRSRDSSPGARLITREASPVGFRSNENLNIPSHHIGHPPKSQSISPLAMDRQNGFSNGMKDKCKIEKFLDSRSSINVCQGFSEVDKGVWLSSTFPEISPISNKTTTKRSPGSVHVASYNQQNRSYSSNFSTSSPKTAAVNVSNTSFSETSLLNGSSIGVENHLLNSSSSSEKSFIQQRVERLYGPGALAQGFFFKRSSNNKLNTSDSSFNKSNNDNKTSVENSNTEESLKNLPVLRHLRPEFRAQLPVVSTRKPTDGSEQIIKPLQRLSVASRKSEAKEKVSVVETVNKEDLKNNSLKLSSSTTSITDQQPAAPQVVLPVLESSTSKPKKVKEEEKTIVEKNGHYFMKLLKEERDKLISLADSAETELADSDPSELPEEAAGKLRSAGGKARLLASQKMQQFEGLCHKNINQVEGEEFPTKNEDLAGFWDMLMLQVVQVHELFEQIDRLKKSKWQEIVPEKRSVSGIPQNRCTPKRRLTPAPKIKPTPTSEANKKAREAREQSRRQMIEERRRAMRSMSKNADNPVEIFIPET